jgi:hypothetical protein
MPPSCVVLTSRPCMSWWPDLLHTYTTCYYTSQTVVWDTVFSSPSSSTAASRDALNSQVRVQITMRPTVSQSVSLGFQHQIFTSITVWQLRSCFCGAPCLRRRRVCLLYMLLGQCSLSRDRVPLGIVTIFYCLRFETSLFVASTQVSVPPLPQFWPGILVI